MVSGRWSTTVEGERHLCGILVDVHVKITGEEKTFIVACRRCSQRQRRIGPLPLEEERAARTTDDGPFWGTGHCHARGRQSVPLTGGLEEEG